MKNIFTKIGLTTLGIIFSLSVFILPKNSEATFFYTSLGIDYIVTASNIPPVANAGTNVNLNSPTSSTTFVPGQATATDADGTVVSTVWSQVSGPVSAGIASGSTLTPTFSGMTSVGTYTFRLTVIDDQGATDFDDMQVIISAPSNVPPVSVPGPNQSIAQPMSAVSVDGSLSYDPDGTIVSYLWQQNMVGAPATATIVSPNSAQTSITGLTALGTYRFALTVTDNVGATNSASMTVTVNASGSSVSVTLTALPNLFPSGGGMTYLSWTSSNATSCVGTNFSTGGLLNQTNQPEQIGVTTTYRIDCTNGLASAHDEKTVTVLSTADTINGRCAANHFLCVAGNSTNNQTSATSWTWDCQGMNGGTTASCTEDFQAGKPQCSDEVDNDGDALIDIDDPGCHTDGKANNSATYVPTDDDERNSPKIKVIEI